MDRDPPASRDIHLREDDVLPAPPIDCVADGDTLHQAPGDNAPDRPADGVQQEASAPSDDAHNGANGSAPANEAEDGGARTDPAASGKVPWEFVQEVLAAIRARNGGRPLQRVPKPAALEGDLSRMGLPKADYDVLSLTAALRLVKKYASFMRQYRDFHHCNIMSGRQLELLQQLNIDVHHHGIPSRRATALINATRANRDDKWKKDNVMDFMQ